MDSFFLLFVFIIGLAKNINTCLVRYCFFDSGHYLSTITTSAYVRNTDLYSIADFDRFAFDVNLGLESKYGLTSRITPTSNIPGDSGI